MTLDFQEDHRLRVVWPSGSRYGTWAVDRGHDPIHLTLDLDDRDPLKTIVRFPDPDTLNYVDVSSSSPRPETFDVDVLTFRRRSAATR